MESLLINRSVKVDPKVYIPRVSDEPVDLLKNNYAPLERRLSDSMNTRRIYPTARYLTSEPPLEGMSTGVAELSRRMENRKIPILDRVKLVNSSARISGEISVPPDQIHITEGGNAFSRVAEEEERTGKTRINNTLAEYISWASEQASHPISAKIPTGQGPIRVNKEGFAKNKDTILDNVYLIALRSRIVSVLDFISQMPEYGYWDENWREMERNLSRNGSITFERLEESDADAAFVISKGDEKKIKIRARDFKYIPINISQYVLYHECAHLANFEYGHGKKFQELLALLCLAAFQLEYIRLERMPEDVYVLDGVPILSKEDMKNEILDGIRAIQSVSILNSDYYEALGEFVKTF